MIYNQDIIYENSLKLSNFVTPLEYGMNIEEKL